MDASSRNFQFSYMMIVAPVAHAIRNTTTALYGPTIQRKGMDGHFNDSSVIIQTGNTAMATVLISKGSPCQRACIISSSEKNMMSLL
jgi:hypothetical protein